MAKLLTTLDSASKSAQGGLAVLARCIGFAGMLGLVCCALYAVLPGLPRPAHFEHGLLPMYACISLLASSFLGWSCMQRGMQDIRLRSGEMLGGFLIVVLPLAGFALIQAEMMGLVEPSDWKNGERIHLVALWYPLGLMLASLLVYVGEQAEYYGRVRPGRVLAALALITPYVLILSWLTFELPLPVRSLDESLQGMVRSLGATTVMLQIMLAFFFGTTSPG